MILRRTPFSVIARRSGFYYVSNSAEATDQRELIDTKKKQTQYQ
jgi:hypothetical protein